MICTSITFVSFVQGCYDAGVRYLQANASGLIALAIVIALLLVCSTVFSYNCDSIVKVQTITIFYVILQFQISVSFVKVYPVLKI